MRPKRGKTGSVSTNKLMSFGFVSTPTLNNLHQPARTRPVQQFPTVLRSGLATEFVFGTVTLPTTIHAAEFSEAEEVAPKGSVYTLFYPMTKWKDEVRMRVKLVDPITADVQYKWMVVFREKADGMHTRHVTFAARDK